MSKFIHVLSKEYCVVKTPKIVAPSQYPSEWFNSAIHKKPIAYSNKGGVESKNLFTVVRYGIGNNHLNINVVKYFIFEYFQNVTGVLDVDWISYGVTIGTKGDEIKPWNLIDIIKKDNIIKDLSKKVCEESDIRWMVSILLCSSRLMGITIDSYSDALKTRMLSQMRILGCRLGAFPPKTLYETWVLDESHNKMIAAIDMFFNKFPSHEDSSMKICTLRSRFKDCSELLSIKKKRYRRLVKQPTHGICAASKNSGVRP